MRKYGGKAHMSGLHRDINVSRPLPLGARPGVSANQAESHGSCSTDLKD